MSLQVMGAYFEKLGSKSFAVYSIAVTDAENRTWFVKRRFLSHLCHNNYNILPTLCSYVQRIFIELLTFSCKESS